MENYLPFGFVYPDGFPQPDPAIEAIRTRMAYLNQAHQHSDLPGHIFTAAMAKLQQAGLNDVDVFWDAVQTVLTPQDLAGIAKALADTVTAQPRLEFPNAIALFDCRFISTKEWEHIRRYSIGGSEAAAVLGISHFQSPRSIFGEKRRTPLPNHDIGRQHIFAYGHAVEDFVIDSAAEKLGAERCREHRMFAHKEYPCITCNPDEILRFPDGRLALYEAKTAYRMKADEWRLGMPDYYVPQPRQYLEVLNDPRLTDGYIGVCFGGSPRDQIIHKFERDAKAGAEQIQKIVEYWTGYIVPDKLPPLTGDASLDLEALYRYDDYYNLTKSKEQLPDSTIPLFERWIAIKQERKELAKKIADASALEAAALAKIEETVPPGLTICTKPGGLSYAITVKDTAREAVDQAKLPPALKAELVQIAQRIKETSCGFTTPKISEAAVAVSK